MTQLVQNKPKETIRDYLESDLFKDQVARSLPDGMTPAHFVQSAVTAVIRNRKLLECSRESLFKCLMDLSAMGLTPDGRRAHLIPFGNLCTLIVDYKGIAELVRRNGDVRTIHCDVVGKNDQFVCRYGTDARMEHIPLVVDRGDIYAVYSFVTLPNGAEEWEVMSKTEVEEVRKRSRAANDGPWVTDWNAMAKKTVFRRHSKTLPLSPDTRRALEYGEEEEFGFKHAVPAKVPITKAQKALMPDDLVDLSPDQSVEEVEKPSQAPPAPPAAPKTTKGVKRVEKAPESAQKSANEPKKGQEHELFGEEEPQDDADRLILALRRDKIEWEAFARWIISTGALGQNVTDIPPVNFLKPELLADCVQNYAANVEEYRHWEANTPK